MRILVCGSRDWTDVNAIADALEEALDSRVGEDKHTRPTFIHGGASRGADALCEAAASRIIGWPQIDRFPADWEKYGKAAGPIRNQQMLKEGKPDLVLAFWNGISRGTLDMVTRAKAAGVKVRIIRGE